MKFGFKCVLFVLVLLAVPVFGASEAPKTAPSVSTNSSYKWLWDYWPWHQQKPKRKHKTKPRRKRTPTPLSTPTATQAPATPKPSPSTPLPQTTPTRPQEVPTAGGPQELSFCTFNIQFLGEFKHRDNQALARILKAKGCQLIFIQEMDAPPDFRVLKDSPWYGQPNPPTYPGTDISEIPSEATTNFFLAMEAEGFSHFVVSEEDTGPGSKNHLDSSATEWWLAFYLPEVVEPADDLPHGFLSADHTQNPFFDRVPYAFPFRTKDQRFDFVVISVHLHPDDGTRNQKRRQQEMAEIRLWIDQQEEHNSERDYLILGDMNIEDNQELQSFVPKGMISLNTNAQYITNTEPSNPKPYDQVVIDPSASAEIPAMDNFQVLNLIQLLPQFSTLPAGITPWNPYVHDTFRQYYSDHNPVLFKARTGARDDD